jgi:membrane-bound ClpP family serine protease
LIILGIILVLIGWLASISILTTIGIILIVVGLVLAVLGSMGRDVGGRKHWY